MSSSTETSPGPSAMPPAAEEAPGAGRGRALWRAADRWKATLLGHHSSPEEQDSPEQQGLSPTAPRALGRAEVQGLLVADASSHAANGWRDGSRMCRRPFRETPRGAWTKGCSDWNQKRAGEEVDAGREHVWGVLHWREHRTGVTPGRGAGRGAQCPQSGQAFGKSTNSPTTEQKAEKGGCGHGACGVGRVLWLPVDCFCVLMTKEARSPTDCGLRRDRGGGRRVGLCGGGGCRGERARDSEMRPWIMIVPYRSLGTRGGKEKPLIPQNCNSFVT